MGTWIAKSHVEPGSTLWRCPGRNHSSEKDQQCFNDARSGRRRVTGTADSASHTGARRALPVTSSNDFKKE